MEAFDGDDLFLSDEDHEDPKIITPQNRALFNYNTEAFEESQDSFDIPPSTYLGVSESDFMYQENIERDLMSSFAEEAIEYSVVEGTPQIGWSTGLDGDVGDISESVSRSESFSCATSSLSTSVETGSTTTGSSKQKK